MGPGPPKAFDPDRALESARDLFWEHGFDGTGIRDLESALGIGRKSLYDTFGSKRELYLRAIEHYADTVIRRIRSRLASHEDRAWNNLQRVLERLQRHHASGESQGCLLGVAMAQAGGGDDELAECLGRVLQGLERAFEETVRRAQGEGDLRPELRPKDVARQLVALTQGMALLGRVALGPAQGRSVVRATLDSLRSPAVN